jgi:CDGSH-type Zn-finger protein
MEESAHSCHCLPWLVTGLAVFYGAYITMKWRQTKSGTKKGSVNLCVQKEQPKVVHALDIEDLGSKTVFCRCWRSKKFPYCDGAHTQHNEETGDNVGPLIVKRKET